MTHVSTIDPKLSSGFAATQTRDALSGLADSFIELFSRVHSFRLTAAQQQPAYPIVRGEILRLLKQSESFPAQGGCSWEEYDQARFAVCAWIDETVMAAAWESVGKWRPEPLQRLYYNTTDAGQKFFERLKELGVAQNAVREVYYLCLVLGFEGRYCGPDGTAALQQIKAQQLRLLFNGTAELPTLASFEKARLFPEARVQGPVVAPPRPTPSNNLFITRFIIVGSMVLVIILYLVFRLSLHSLGGNILRAVGKA